MRLLLASDIHCDLDACDALADRSGEADALFLAGDYASQHHGLGRTVDRLARITTPTILIPGNNETTDALRDACKGWSAATVIHAQTAAINGLSIYGLGAGIPPIGQDWSFDLEEDEARRRLDRCPADIDILLVHSPPRGHVDVTSAGDQAGSLAILEAIESRRPRLVVCGHIHDCWGRESRIGSTRIINAGPQGRMIDLEEGVGT